MPEITAEMSSTVWKLIASEGAHVEVGDVIAILESMKMEMPVETQFSGTVRFKVDEGADVSEGTVIAEISAT
jgi:acetyl-CoA carboxylase biotin carboxyl carrier protein